MSNADGTLMVTIAEIVGSHGSNAAAASHGIICLWIVPFPSPIANWGCLKSHAPFGHILVVKDITF